MNLLTKLNYVPVRRYNPETTDYVMRVISNGGTISDASVNALATFVQDCNIALTCEKLVEVVTFASVGLVVATVKIVHPAGLPGLLTNVYFVSGGYDETGVKGGSLIDGATKCV